MQTFTALVAIGNDPMNKTPVFDITPAEIMVLQRIHGFEAVTQLKLSGTPRRNHAAERDRLNRKFPKHMALVTDIWRDQGGKFPTDISELNLPSSYFAADALKVRDELIEAGDGEGKAAGPVEPEDEEAVPDI